MRVSLPTTRSIRRTAGREKERRVVKIRSQIRNRIETMRRVHVAEYKYIVSRVEGKLVGREGGREVEKGGGYTRRRRYLGL